MSSNSTNSKNLVVIQSEALSYGVPAFDISYLKEESKEKYRAMNEEEKKSMQIKWYSA